MYTSDGIQMPNSLSSPIAVMVVMHDYTIRKYHYPFGSHIGFLRNVNITKEHTELWTHKFFLPKFPSNH